MRLKVLYFASARDITGKRVEQLSLDEVRTMKDLTQKLRDIHPGLKALESSTRYAVNLEIVGGDAILHEGDEVGVLPAVTGG